MNSIKKALKKALIDLAANDQLPTDLYQLDENVFNEALQPLVTTLTRLHKSCQEAIDGTWAVNDDGFRAMQWSIEKLVDIDYEGPIYQDSNDSEEGEEGDDE